MVTVGQKKGSWLIPLPVAVWVRLNLSEKKVLEEVIVLSQQTCMYAQPGDLSAVEDKAYRYAAYSSRGEWETPGSSRELCCPRKYVLSTAGKGLSQGATNVFGSTYTVELSVLGETNPLVRAQRPGRKLFSSIHFISFRLFSSFKEFFISSSFISV